MRDCFTIRKLCEVNRSKESDTGGIIALDEKFLQSFRRKEETSYKTKAYIGVWRVILNLCIDKLARKVAD
jgi:hypothetical protein